MNSGFVQFTNGGETVTVNADIEILPYFERII